MEYNENVFEVIKKKIYIYFDVYISIKVERNISKDVPKVFASLEKFSARRGGCSGNVERPLVSGEYRKKVVESERRKK